ncbi:MAG: carboxypeptidase M32 [Planctomycetes bacterium]|nr:carboxypeptidase M32 [Planctomycetota bacterium]
MTQPRAYDELCSMLRDTAVLDSAQRVLAYDQETVMPEGGAGLRSQQLEMMSALVHKKRTDARIGELLSACEKDASLDEAARANVREVRRDYDRATRLPTDLVAEMARCSSLGMHAWKEARAKSDFSVFLPWLEKTVELSRRKAECYANGRVPAGGELYDFLLDEYEPGMTAAATRAVFGPFRAALVPLIEKVAKSKAPDELLAHAEYPVERQAAFATMVSKQMGFDYATGRMDVSTHPFCDGIGPGDTRMTNRYRPDGWADSLGTAMHEGGHALYEQGLPKGDRFGQPLAEAVSLGIHESQSRLWENLVGRSRAFWTWAAPKAGEMLGGVLKSAAPDAIHKAVNIVRPNFIRVESDELTYNLHIMLRFDLERAMVAEELSPKDLPGEWNRRVKSDLGLTVPDDRRGCLQDVHWSMGLVGYFPTYTFGNLYSAQFWEAAQRDLPERDAMLGRGEFAPVLDWLRRNIHAHGRRYSAGELCQRVTGKPLTHDALMRHLERKVAAVYG